MNEVLKCPRCGGVLEVGFIQAPKGIYWDTKEFRYFSLIHESNALISMWKIPLPGVRAWKCPTCRLAIFEYREGVKP
jgi:hypothetical protein